MGITTPRLQLKGFAKAKDLAPGATQKVIIKLDRYAVSFWDTERAAWHAAAGQYSLHAGPSSDNLPLQVRFKLQESLFWTGL